MPTTLDDLMRISNVRQLPPEQASELLAVITEIESLSKIFKRKLSGKLDAMLSGTPATKLIMELSNLRDYAASLVDRIEGLSSENAFIESEQNTLLHYKGLNYEKLTYELVAKVADDFIEMGMFVSWLQVAKTIGYKEKGRYIGMYLKRWAKEVGAKSEIVNLGNRRIDNHGGSLTVYYKGERPLILNIERVQDAIKRTATGEEKIVDIHEIMELASLPWLNINKLSAQSILGKLRYEQINGTTKYRLKRQEGY